MLRKKVFNKNGRNYVVGRKSIGDKNIEKCGYSKEIKTLNISMLQPNKKEQLAQFFKLKNQNRVMF
jgi:hypothetical protein